MTSSTFTKWEFSLNVGNSIVHEDDCCEVKVFDVFLKADRVFKILFEDLIRALGVDSTYSFCIVIVGSSAYCT